MRKSTGLKGSAVLLAVALAGCSSSSGNPASSSTVPTPSTSRTTPTPSPSTKSPEDVAAEKAESLLRDYYRAIPRCLADPPTAPPTCFDPVAITSELTNLRNTLASAQAAQTKASGPLNVVSLTRKSVSLENKPKDSPPVVPEVVFMACVDVSSYNIVDKDGKSIVPPNRKPHVLSEVHVANYKYPDPTQWRVAFTVPQKEASC